MSDVKVVLQTQQIIVNPATQSVSVILAGPPGPPGPPGQGVANPDSPVILTYKNGVWPDADVPASTPVIWSQPVVGGPPPPAGGRPGRVAFDIVLIRQA